MWSPAWPLLGPEGEEPLHLGCGQSPRLEEAEGEGALQDLMDLAGEGMTLTQWTSSAAQPVEERGPERVPDRVLQSSLDGLESLEKKLLLQPPLENHSPPLLGLLATAFKGMVNNPHLSDVQIQGDSGELFYAHLFVLYARCPQLMEEVGQKGFWAAEGGGGRGGAKARRVLLSNVSGEAIGVFLNYLYTAEPFVPQRVQSEVAVLAVRFGVRELAALCTRGGWRGSPVLGASGQDEEGRAGALEELLKAVWGGQEEEEPGTEDVVGEKELEEIYEFASTQRKAKEEEERHSCERSRGSELGAHPPVEEGEGRLDLEPSQLLQGREAGRKEAAMARSPLEPPPPDAEGQQRPLGAASRSYSEEEEEKVSRDLGQRSLPAVSWGGHSLELFQQSDSDRDPSGGGVTLRMSSTPLGLEKGLVPLPLNGPSGDSRGPLEGWADQLPPSPAWRVGFSSDLFLPLFSPAPQESRGEPCPAEEQRGSPAGAAAGSGSGSHRDATATLPSLVDLDAPPKGLMLGPGAERRRCRGPGEQQVGRRRFPPREWGASGASDGPLGQEVDIPCGQSGRAPSLERLLVLGADAGRGEGVGVPATPLLSSGAPRDGQVAKFGLTSGPEAQGPGEAQGSRPTRKSVVIPPSPERSPLQVCPPLSHCPPSLLPSSTCPSRGGKSVADVVVILDDSEEEEEAVEAAPQQSWGSSVLEADLPVSEDDAGGGHLFHVASSERSAVGKPSPCPLGSPPRPLLTSDDDDDDGGTPPGPSLTAGRDPWARFGSTSSSCGSPRQRKLTLGGPGGSEMETLPLAQRLPASKSLPETPDLVCQERGAPCRTPPTPMPSYSAMETPVLKKELSRFGVRTLPKQQMVLKLKEIFQYTHLRVHARDGATVSSSHPSLCHGGAQSALRSPVAVPKGFPQQRPACPEELPQVLLLGGCLGAASRADGDQRHRGKKDCLPAGSGRRKRRGQALAPSQEAGWLSGATRDNTSVMLQSSSTEFETSVLEEEEEEQEEDTASASQSTCREANMLEELQLHIRSRPALWRQVLLYQPFELARLQTGLRQNGIRIALGRLLEFLDARGITFTTAEARREKRQQQPSGHRGGRRRRRH